MRPLAILIALLAFPSAAAAQLPSFPPASQIFGKTPLTKTVALGMDLSSTPPTPIRLVCSYCPHFMVQDFSDADEGDQIAFAPAGAPCKPPKTTSTITQKLDFPASLWGAIGDYAFIIGTDCLNDGETFVIINPKSRNILAESTAYPAPAHARLIPGGLIFDFTAQLDLRCSVLAPGSTCAASVKKQIGEPVPIALCVRQYQPSQTAIDSECSAKGAPGWCKTAAADEPDSSVINYPARLTLLNGIATTTATGAITACFPSD